jgi:hypothetical protein
MDFTNWYQENYPYLSGHGLWLRGNELNTISAREWDSRPFRVLISRLSTYRDTVDSFTHTLLYQLISRIDGAFPDLAWLPPPKDAALFDRDNIPWLLGATSKRPGRDFSVIALSLSIVQEMVNIPAMLERSGIPLSHGERTADPACPLVILGGASALYTSALFCDDPLIDGVFIGEDASTISGLFKLIREGLAAGSGRAEILDRLTGVPGFFIPKHFPRTRVFHAATISGAQLLTSGPVLTDVTAVGRGHLQISEGCACFCGFCAESFVRKPYRELDADTVRSAALDAKKNMAVYDCELYSFNFSMHRNWYRIQADLASLFPSIGLKSQRFDAIANDAGLLDWLHALDTGVSVDFLAHQWEAARRFDDAGHCAGTVKGAGTCRFCGACASDETRQRITALPERAPFPASELRRRMASWREAERLFHFRVAVLEKAAGLPRAIVGIALGRALMRVDDRLVEGYRGYRGAVSIKNWGSDWIIGDDCSTLAWDTASEGTIREVLADSRNLARINDEMNGYGTVVRLVSDTAIANGSIIFRSPFRFNPDGYCKTKGIKYTMRKTGEGAYRCEFSKESLKKKILAGLSLVIHPSRWVVTVTPEPKFRAEGFAQSAFDLPDPAEWVRIGMNAVFAETTGIQRTDFSL